MLQVRDLVLAYGSHRVVNHLDLDLVRGEVLGLIGPNGAGKTSLIRAVSGILRPLAGSIHANGADLLELHEDARARLVSVLPQSAQLPPAFTVWDCVALGRTPHLNWLGRLGETDRKMILWALEACGIGALSERRAGELSGGEQQRVLLARALAQDCPILLMDEPTAHLDIHHQVAIFSLVRRMAAERGLTVLVAIHDLNLAAIYADRLALLVEGQLRAIGRPYEVLTAENLRQAYQVPLSVHPNPANGLPWVALLR